MDRQFDVVDNCSSFHALITSTSSATCDSQQWPVSNIQAELTGARHLPWTVNTDFVSFNTNCTSTESTSVVRFTAAQFAHSSTIPIVNCNSSPANVSFHGKRKAFNIDLDVGPNPPKVFVNEERMAARMNDLHLDNDMINSQLDTEEHWVSQHCNSCDEADKIQQTSCINSHLLKSIQQSTAQLELCRELQLSLDTKRLLPQVILNELNKPSMQVVLWRPPPSDFVKEIISSKEKNVQSMEAEDKAIECCTYTTRQTCSSVADNSTFVDTSCVADEDVVMDL